VGGTCSTRKIGEKYIQKFGQKTSREEKIQDTHEEMG
jgi:hypothetical protein